MEELEATLRSIEDNVRRLVAERDAIREDLKQWEETCRSMEQTIKNQNIIISNLEKNNNILKLGNTLTQRGDTTELKLKINQLIRNIDKSLELLNKA